jgi:hypothetical protein
LPLPRSAQPSCRRRTRSTSVLYWRAKRLTLNARPSGVALGDRRAISEVLAASPQLGWLAKRAIPRFFTVPELRQRELERLPFDLCGGRGP